MALYAMSDLHLSQSIEKPMDVFGSRWIGYTDKIIERWNETVKDEDTVIVPGDISWGMNVSESKADFELIRSLNGRKIISKGNHDYWWGTASKLKAFFDENAIDRIDILYNNAYIVEDFAICGTRGWYNDDKNAPDGSDYAKIVARECGRLRLSIDCARRMIADCGEEKELIAFMHFPPVYRDYVCSELVDVLSEYEVKRCFYGHIHGVYDIPPVRVYEGISFEMVSADYLDFYPKIIEKKS